MRRVSHNFTQASHLAWLQGLFTSGVRRSRTVGRQGCFLLCLGSIPNSGIFSVCYKLCICELRSLIMTVGAGYAPPHSRTCEILCWNDSTHCDRRCSSRSTSAFSAAAWCETLPTSRWSCSNSYSYGRGFSMDRCLTMIIRNSNQASACLLACHKSEGPSDTGKLWYKYQIQIQKYKCTWSVSDASCSILLLNAFWTPATKTRKTVFTTEWAPSVCTGSWGSSSTMPLAMSLSGLPLWSA